MQTRCSAGHTGGRPAAIGESTITRPHIALVVEDDAAIRRLLEALLASAGYDVQTAVDGPEALDRFARERPDIVFLDVSLGQMSGWEVLERLRHRSGPPPIVLLTANHAAIRRARDEGADAAILKPFDIDEVLDTARRLLGDPRNGSDPTEHA